MRKIVLSFLIAICSVVVVFGQDTTQTAPKGI